MLDGTALPCLGNANDVLFNKLHATELPIVPQANAHADFSTGNFMAEVMI